MENFSAFCKVFPQMTLRNMTVLCLFGVVEGKKFKDLSEYLDCVQRVWKGGGGGERG